MSDSWIITKLEAKYRELRSAKAYADEQSVKLAEQMEHVRAVMRLFQEAAPHRKHLPRRWTHRGDGLRTALDVLREANEPLTGDELVRRMFARHGWPEPDRTEVRSANASLQYTLRKRADVRKLEGRPARWELIR